MISVFSFLFCARYHLLKSGARLNGRTKLNLVANPAEQFRHISCDLEKRGAGLFIDTIIKPSLKARVLKRRLDVKWDIFEQA